MNDCQGRCEGFDVDYTMPDAFDLEIDVARRSSLWYLVRQLTGLGRPLGYRPYVTPGVAVMLFPDFRTLESPVLRVYFKCLE